MCLGISAKCAAIAPSATFAMDAKAKALKASGISVVGFAAGEPDFDTPAFIRDAMKEAMELGMTHYTPVAGTLELRDAIIARLKRDHGLTYGRDEVIVSNGAKHTLYTAFQTLLDPGDEVVIPTPCWVSYPEMVKMAGGTPVFVEGREEEGFIPSLEEIAEKITPRTKIFMLTSPSNPNGCVWSLPMLQALAELAVKRGFHIISDEIYGKLVYGDSHSPSIASLGVQDRTLLVDGVSKSYAMTGFRIGYAAGPRHIIQAMTTYQSQATSAPNAAAQHAAAVALNGDQSCVEEMRRAFQQRRDRMVELINAIPGLSCTKPEGAFYVMMNIKKLVGKKYRNAEITGSAYFAELLLEQAHVAVVPGNAFMAEGYCRLSYSTSMENIEEGMRRIAAFVEELK